MQYLPVLAVCAAAVVLRVNARSTDEHPVSLGAVDCRLSTLYGCSGNPGANNYSDYCRKNVATNPFGYLYLGSDFDTYRLEPVSDADGHYKIGESCDSESCAYHWTYSSLTGALYTSSYYAAVFKMTKNQTVGGYRFTIMDNCEDGLEPEEQTYPCGYQVSFAHLLDGAMRLDFNDGHDDDVRFKLEDQATVGQEIL